MSVCNFKSGNTVTFKKDLIVGQKYGGYTFSSDMLQLLDLNFLIVFSSKDYYQLDSTANGYYVTDEMLDRVNVPQTISCLDLILEQLDLELNEEFEINTRKSGWQKYKFNENGLYHVNGCRDSNTLTDLLTAKLEYKHIIKLVPTKEEQEILDAAKKLGFNWVAKDKNEVIDFYENKPIKCDSYWDFSSENDIASLKSKVDFKFLSWEDDQPYEL